MDKTLPRHEIFFPRSAAVAAIRMHVVAKRSRFVVDGYVAVGPHHKDGGICVDNQVAAAVQVHFATSFAFAHRVWGFEH